TNALRNLFTRSLLSFGPPKRALFPDADAPGRFWETLRRIGRLRLGAVDYLERVAGQQEERARNVPLDLDLLVLGSFVQDLPDGPFGADRDRSRIIHDARDPYAVT